MLFDIVVVGAGAAGLVTAIWAGRTARAASTPLAILLLDSRHKIGAKILMSGGTRCNVTHRTVRPADFNGGPSHFVKHVLEAFTPQQTILFFKELGVELVLEATGKYFPTTHSARTVLDALTAELGRSGVTLQTGVRISEIRKTGGLFELRGDNGTFQTSARRVVLTSGGLSHPTTGSDGAGHRIARDFGHTIVATYPALTPLTSDDPQWKALSGISLETRISFYRNGKKTRACEGPFLFTHFGFSGPAALDISRHVAAAQAEERPQIRVNFLPRHDEATLAAAFRSAQTKSPRRHFQNLLAEEFSLPARFAQALLIKAGIRRDAPIGQCSGDTRKRLIRMLLHYPLEVTGVYGYAKAEVTAGGVDLNEVKVSTLESKRVEGLYFAGEILDADGRIGGFNFQWAWSTGAVAGRSAARGLIS